ncbi:JAB domain-containing protein [Filobacillus milosensis]|uniref:JAB domain-containing protein n=1 Tax=Filobacillus milosensis TaxID=94137 RepID=A0A4Y8IUQ6_9BACI|nr:DNA repair protein RadC [Filobacillus milosensis]TFB24936.1 JAB domain-containing protein [Filobacillus milosensis]
MNTDSIFIKDVPKDDRPRERLIQAGPQALSNQELIAILMGSGTKGTSALSLATRVLVHFEGLSLLKGATINELTMIKGIGEAKAVSIMAAIELGKRLHSFKVGDRFTIRSPEDGANFLMEEMRDLKQEHFVALYLDTKNQVIHRQTIFIGSLNSSIVHPREVFKEAIKRSAASVICAHNHPSGDPAPSNEDIHVTKRLSESGKVIGIELLDHLVIGDQKFISLKEKGYL